MPNKRLRYMGKTYEVEPWGGARNVDTPPTSAESSPVHKKLRTTEDSKEIVHRRFTDNMDGDTEMEETAPQAAKAGASSSGSVRHHHETKIINLRPHYGIPDVITTVLPWTMYFSAVSPATNDSSTSTWFSFRTTSLADIFPRDLSDPSENTTYSAGLYNSVAGKGTKWPVTSRAFPVSGGTGTQQGEKAQWLLWFARQYQAYSVLKCEWEVSMHNPRDDINGDLIVGYGTESYGTSEGKIYPDASLKQAEHWPDLKFKVLRSSADGTDGQNWTTISGTYYPGQEASHVRNDEEVATWVKYTSAIALPTPSLNECMRFFIWKGPFNALEEPQAVNVRLSLRLTVQFRDLLSVFRYPAGQTSVTLTAPTDIRYSVV